MQPLDRSTPGISLYRFQPCWEWDRKSLRAEKIDPDSLWASNPASLNDPLDMTPPYDLHYLGLHNKKFAEIGRKMAAIMYATEGDGYPIAIINPELRKNILKWSEGKVGNDCLLEAFQQRIASMGVACFTTAFDNAPMWGHYADNGAGFILEYNVQQMTMAMSNNNLDWFQSWVSYSSQSPKYTLSELLLTPLPCVKRVLTTKTLPWSYENEWRLIHFNGGNVAQPIPKGMQLKSVILGPKSPPEQSELLNQKCNDWGIPCRRVQINDDRQFVIPRDH